VSNHESRTVCWLPFASATYPTATRASVTGILRGYSPLTDTAGWHPVASTWDAAEVGGYTTWNSIR
jgi:hypothetical protein